MAEYNENNIIYETTQSIPTTKNPMADYQIYKTNYYTGSDISIYIGDTWVDEITGIQFVLDEKFGPIYGYADYTWAHLATGNRIVSGAFTMNFTDPAYLNGILDMAKASNLKSLPDLATRQTKIITGQTVNNMDFDTYAAQQESYIWGELNDASYKSKTNSASLAKYSFDIVIGYGATNNGKCKIANFRPKPTVQILKNVTIIKSTSMIDTSDNIIGVIYEFVAQDVVIPN